MSEESVKTAKEWASAMTAGMLCLRQRESERDFLDTAESFLDKSDYQAFEQVLEQGYAEVLLQAPDVASSVYLCWCETFNKLHICAYTDEESEMEAEFVFIEGLKTEALIDFHRLRSLKKLGWEQGLTPSRILKWYVRLDAVEESIQEALDILELPFEKGLPLRPPVMNRYERLMGDSDVSTV